MSSLLLLGDGLAAGYGDSRHLGWWGRVLARTALPDAPHTASLPVWEETTTALARRWQAEVALRIDPPSRLVVAVGSADVRAGLSLARSRLNLADVVDVAQSEGHAVFVVGPPPALETDQRGLAALSAAFADVCGRRSIPYVDLYTPLAAHEPFLTDLGTFDGIHPTQVGYGMIAWLVLRNQWYAFSGGTPAS